MGYHSLTYAESFNDIGTPCQLVNSNSWIIKRKIPYSNYSDAMGCYPFLVCSDWNELPKDISLLENKLVSLTIITDPLGDYSEQLLEGCFPDLCRPFKKHFLVDLHQDWQQTISSNHKRNAKKAYKEIEIDYVPDPIIYHKDWCRLYGVLVKRHNIRGITEFSINAFEHQLQTKGCIAYRAVYKGQTIGMVLWYVHNRVAYYHLGAFDDTGYNKRASFGIFIKALDDFAKQDIKYVSLGAEAGLNTQDDNGLSRFKRGWANTTRTAYICGRILKNDVYKAIVQNKNLEKNEYFPGYRESEFG